VTGPQAANVAARDAAYQAVSEDRVAPTSVIEYRSRGRVLIIGTGDLPDAAAYSLPAPLSAQILRLDESTEDDVSVPAAGRSIAIEGHLGQFEIQLGDAGKPGGQKLTADLILDLCETPRVDVPLKPPGYVWGGAGPEALDAAVSELGQMTGTFEKPRYFEYDASICAHGRSGRIGCSRCVQACPAQAITALVESVEVDPYLCQGGGVCATVCPSGAIRYAYPRLSDLLERLRKMLSAYGRAGGSEPVIALIAEGDANELGDLPGNALVVELEELASAGLEVWLCALAFGAHQVVLIQGQTQPDVVVATVREQVAIGQRILAFLGYDESTLTVITAHDALAKTPSLPEGARKVAHAPMNDKRNMLFAAIDTLAAHLDTTEVAAPMPAAAPFGRVLVNGEACTLCMGCTSVCPVQALVAGGDQPRLLFHEINCVQCGICANACPESAITLEPRLNLDVDARRRGVVLHEEPAFACVQCGKPFATRSVIDRMLDKLKDHPMFATERARRRLMMCDDCRVVDVMQDEDAVNRPM
jgi:ferredoxin